MEGVCQERTKMDEDGQLYGGPLAELLSYEIKEKAETPTKDEEVQKEDKANTKKTTMRTFL